LRHAKELLNSEKINQATDFANLHSHPTLWNLIATYALNKLDLKTAEQAFVRLHDYGGLSFLKKLQNIKVCNKYPF
jgi:WD repeat-containing protein 35